MAIINLKTKEIEENSTGKNLVYVSLPNDRDVYFSSAAAKRFDLQPGKRMFFDNGGGKWACYQTDDQTGFLIHGDFKPTCKSVRVVNRALVRMIRRETRKIVPGTKFMLLNAGHNVNDEPVIEIVTHKTFQEFAKQLA
jgi:hypothetical protein